MNNLIGDSVSVQIINLCHADRLALSIAEGGDLRVCVSIGLFEPLCTRECLLRALRSTESTLAEEIAPIAITTKEIKRLPYVSRISGKLAVGHSVKLLVGVFSKGLTQ